MNLFDLQCRCCGGDLVEIEGAKRVAKCQFCGRKQSVPIFSDEKRANQFNRAEQLRKNNDYDKAISLYEKLIEEDPTDPEAYWCMVLCRYGIEYVKDPRSGAQLPTVNRAQYTSILADEDYRSAIKYATPEQKELYEEEAHQINEIQKGILDIASREEPFDIFICYKESDEHGKRTKDSTLAQELYHELERDGYKVFFARVTLDGKLGSAYEPYIFSALNSAKVMVVLGTKPEYFNAVWVRNEWSRFLGLIKNGEKKSLIPAYKDMDAYELPDEFSHLQALNMDKLGFMADLVMGIEKILSFYKKDSKTPEPPKTEPQSAPTPPPRAPEAPKKKKKSKAPIVILCLVLAAAIAAGAIFVPKLLDSGSQEGNTSDTEAGELPAATDAEPDPTDGETEPDETEPEDTVTPGGTTDGTDTEADGESDGETDTSDGETDEETDEETDGDIDVSTPSLEFTSNGDGTCTVTGLGTYVGTDVVIPSASPAGDKVTVIAPDAFSGHSHIVSLTLPSTLTSIGYNAFRDCHKLIEISNHSSLSLTMGSYSSGYVAFYAKNIYTPESGTSNLFEENGFIFYSDPETREYYLVAYVGEETDLLLPDDVNGKDYGIYQYAFTDCDRLTSIVIPTSVTSIGDSAFNNSFYLTDIVYMGTEDAWNALEKGNSWIPYSEDIEVIFGNADQGGEETSPSDGDDETETKPSGGDEATESETETETEIEIEYDENVESVTVSTANELVSLISHINSGKVRNDITIFIGDNIDMGGVEFTPIKTFSGTIDGGGYTVSALSIGSDGQTVTVKDGNGVSYDVLFSGLIGASYGATLKNLTLDGVYADVTDSENVFIGSLVGYADGLTVTDCTVNSTIKLNLSHSASRSTSGASGLVGYSLDSSASNVKINCYIEYTANSTEAFAGAALGVGNIRLNDSKVRFDISYTSTGGYGHTGYIIGMENTPSGVTMSEVTGTLISGDLTASGGYAMGIIGQGDSGVIDNMENNCNNTIITGDSVPTLEDATQPTVGKNYLFAMMKDDVVYYATGNKDSYYLGTSSYEGDGAIFSVEETEDGGYYVYCTLGDAKLYLNTVVSGTHINGEYQESASTVYFYDEALNTLVTEIDGITYMFGTRVDQSYTNMTPVSTGSNSYYAQFIPCSQDVSDTADHVCSFDIRAVTQEPTCTEYGLATLSCSCGKRTVEKIDPLGHDEIEHDAQDPTCTEVGWNAYVACSRCEYTTYSEIPATGHDYVNVGDKCSKCGAVKYSDGLTFSQNSDGYGYTVASDGTVSGSVLIPDEYGGLPVTAIASNAFKGNTSITGVTFPQSLNTIGASAFSGCTGLTSLSIPEGTATIGNAAFDGCANLEAVILPQGIETIGGYAFRNCTGIGELTIADSVLSIGSSAFGGCTNITNITVPSIAITSIPKDSLVTATVTSGDSIPDSAFKDAPALTSVTLPGSITVIDELAFFGCSQLESVTFSDESQLTTISNTAFMNCTALTGITLSESMHTIGQKAFLGCSALESINIPSGVCGIGAEAFLDCSSLQSVTFGDGCGVSQIESCTFKNCENLTQIDFGQNSAIATIGDGSFSGCTSLTSISIPDSVSTISSYAFDGCNSLGELNFGENSVLTSIGENGFANCALTALSLPDTLETIGSHAFIENLPLADVTLPESLETLGPYAFNGCTGIRSVYVPSTLGTVGDNVFRSCSGIESAIIPISVLGQMDKTSLTQLTLTSGDAIGDYALSGCSNLERVVIPTTVLSINHAAFLDCGKLTDVVFLEGSQLQSIGMAAFRGCASLKSLYIPATVTSITADQLFMNCISLTALNFGGTEEQWKAIGYTPDASITVTYNYVP